MLLQEKYEAVIGLEVHAQLATVSKLFCGDSTAFGAAPNSQVSPITLGHPGTLPKTNKKAVAFAIKMGLACHCEIEKDNYFARKNYFYPDLPKGYQISQHTTPICKGGYVTIHTTHGRKDVQLNRIHLEEDAGKSIHDLEEEFTCIDLNRAGTPLIEIVTEPCIHSAEEAWHYVTEIRKLVQWLGICDGNMEEGSLRCDANISVRLKGVTKLGTRVEVKNLNSIRNVKKAIEFEIDRLIGLLEAGNPIQQQTRSFDASNDTTFAIRDKEEANDYRYFPDPDLAPFHLRDKYINSIKDTLPELPDALAARYKSSYGLSEYDASQLCDTRSTADYFETVIAYSKHYKAIANWILGPLRQYLNEQQIDFAALTLEPAKLAAIIELVENGKVSFSVASSKLLPVVLEKNEDPLTLAESMNLIQISDQHALEKWVNEAMEAMPEKVAEYRKGKKGLIGLFVGEVKKRSQGKADPKQVTILLEQKLNQ
ncbi:Asp-tRNA(Asn)/Glu-tRNA(Gln) amidotransferase subunit GatB [Sediminibacterium goheungense]|uniref:Aspartyl/glutamyl-tRNA(Asn/Gln) amidotransferase subunit B n=1 Tax=Sediminibacterium goheungense TaxID=1086393 RepID=A0A4R6J3U3_9BACT|nr:Asp-tRNA(Asn)/Glu-tRNA(Gln) amidotransferase subunit GatB [Sediminibacterium goheungense]TDO28956.1 aspartyl/glutamyl-tRNA(Asn/Gln) amidotransferase subunit B [Sediminibacterium goheungense]